MQQGVVFEATLYGGVRSCLVKQDADLMLSFPQLSKLIEICFFIPFEFACHTAPICLRLSALRSDSILSIVDLRFAPIAPAPRKAGDKGGGVFMVL